MSDAWVTAFCAFFFVQGVSVGILSSMIYSQRKALTGGGA